MTLNILYNIVFLSNIYEYHVFYHLQWLYNSHKNHTHTHVILLDLIYYSLFKIFAKHNGYGIILESICLPLTSK